MKQLVKFSLLLLAFMLPAIAIAHDFEVDGIYYNINGNEATVTYRGTYVSQYSNEYSGNVIIPTSVTYNGTTYSVTSIGGNAFYTCSGLTSVNIPNSVTTIGSSAFNGCTALTSINIPNSVTSIGYYAFYGTAWYNNQPSGLVYAGLLAYKYKGAMPSGTSITIKEGTVGFAEGAFYNCTGLTSIYIPNSVTSIGDGVFQYCTGLTSIDIPNSVTSIGEHAFASCDGLTQITIPSSVTSIGQYAFYHCSGLSNITIPSSVNHIGGDSFRDCCNLTSIIIPNSITSISDRLFMDCISLSNVIIPSSVTNIGNYAFQGCSGLTSLIIPNSVTTIGDYAFSGCNRLSETLNIPYSVITIGRYAFYNCQGLTNIIIPNSVTSIGIGAFDGTEWYNNQSDGLVYVGLLAYKYKGTMPSGTSITIREGTHGIADGAFSDCSGLISIDIPNSVTLIGNSAFQSCSGLTNIDIPNSITSIGYSAFCNCSGLTYVTIPSSITVVRGSMFYGCSNLTSINIPNSVTSIEACAFYFCSRLSTIHIGNSVNYISLNENTVGDWDGAFVGCSSLTNISVASDNIKYDSRENCNAIIETSTNTLIAGCKGTVIPNSVTSIGLRAFSGCLALTNINIPNSVTHIGFEAFCGCTELTSITCLATTPPTLADSYVYDNYTYSSATLKVPQSSISAYQTANYWKNFTNIQGLANDFEVDGVYYHTPDFSTVKVIPYFEEGYYRGDVVIPDSVTYLNMPFTVTGIDANAFDGCDELNSVVIGDAVETIGEEAFQGCTGLTSVTIGNGVTSIGQRAFNYCNALQTVTCQGTVPPVMANSNCFSSAAYRKATLKVHRKYIDTYTATNYWYKFENIEGFGSIGLGDANCDGEINIADVTTLIDQLLGKNTGSEFYFESADLNGNGHLDIGDVTTLIDLLLWSN